MMTSFVEEFPEKLVYLNFWKTWVEDFPVPAYIRFHSLSAIERFRESMKMENLRVVNSENGPTFETCVAFLDVVKIFLDEKVVLKNARHAFWVEIFKQLTDFMDWTENLKR
uniref:Globin family profile domain-containing protein n=1 Tax=Panagrolaimus sp. JU765 TaxID=591449 RepID=A0AC34Q7C3_9BILA